LRLRALADNVGELQGTDPLCPATVGKGLKKRAQPLAEKTMVDRRTNQRVSLGDGVYRGFR